MNDELGRSLGQLERALDRLREALAQPATNPLAIDGTIQRFEFTIELFWKVMKRLLSREGVDARTPRETLRGAYAAGWLQDEIAWLDMLRARNDTSHAYDEALARRICDDVRRYFPEMAQTCQTLRERAAAP
jgi:nucleotidyltransferase substrate binding protein (TIGR01987 family)